jgi:class 3 adenylate cyclase
MHRISPGAAYQRLTQLLDERLAHGADKAAIDKRIWELFGEQWCVVFTDLSGFSRGVASFGIIHFLQVIHESFKVLMPLIEAHNGFMLKAEGDSMFLLFRNPTAAAECCVDMQKALGAHNKSRIDAEKILLCAGIGWGPMLRIGDEDIFGAEVNAASKLGEDIAKAGEILVTGNVEEALRGRFRFAGIAEVPPGSDRAFRLEY